jgi:hypothetical protein
MTKWMRGLESEYGVSSETLERIIRKECENCTIQFLQPLRLPRAVGTYFFAFLDGTRFLLQIMHWNDPSRQNSVKRNADRVSQYQMMLRGAGIPVVRALWLDFSATHGVALVGMKVGDGELLSDVLARKTLTRHRLVLLATEMLALHDAVHARGFTLHEFRPTNMLFAENDLSLQLVDVARLTKASLPIIHVLNLLSSCKPHGNRHERANYAVLMPIFGALRTRSSGSWRPRRRHRRV